MTRRLLTTLLFPTLLAIAAPPALSRPAAMTDADATRFFHAQGCKTCHARDELRIGPSYRMIAMRYPNATPETVERLRLKVLYGGAGAWGTTPMISHPDISMAEAETVLRWILAAGAEASKK